LCARQAASSGYPCGLSMCVRVSGSVASAATGPVA
jgi:hypothetical protein